MLAAGAQAITGIGFALICAPLLILCVGPRDGVLVVTAFGMILSVLVLAREWRHTNIRHATALLVPACLVAPIAAYIADVAPASTLSIIAGALVLIAIGILASGFRSKHLRGFVGTVISGATSGMMGVLAGIGGPAVAIYAMNADWEVRTLRPTLNVYFIGLSLMALLVRGMPSVDANFGIGLLVAILIGFALGGKVAHRVHPTTVRQMILVLAAIGGVAAIGKGLL